MPANRIDIRRFSWIRKLAADYAFDFGGVAPFFSGNPTQKSAWDDAISRARKQPRDHKQIAAVVSAQQDRRGAPAPAREAAARLADPSTVAVVTGQQAGLFGGPLFTLFKAITAIKLAAEVSREHHANAVAVFWVEAEDHDWDEIRSCTVLDEQLTPRTVALPPDTAPANTPIHRVLLDNTITASIAELEQLLPATEFRDGLLTDLRSAYAPGTGVADAFARWLERVLGHHGLVVFDASDPAAKSLASKVFAQELSSGGETARRATAAGAGMAERGYHAQVQAADGAVALFHMDGTRRPIKPQEAAALVREATARPEAFSPNVLLRPVVQDTLFPTVSYVAGPNELAYLGQLKGVYEYFGLPMPLMYPRASATLVDSAALRFLQKYQVPIETLQQQDEAALNELLQAHLPPEIEASFGRARSAIEESLGQVARALPALDPTLEGAAMSTRSRMQSDLQTLHNKMIQAAKRRDDTMRRQYLRTRAMAYPGGAPQERAVGFVSFLNQYGPALIDRLLDELPLDLGSHWIVSI